MHGEYTNNLENEIAQSVALASYTYAKDSELSNDTKKIFSEEQIFNAPIVKTIIKRKLIIKSNE